MPLIRNQLIKKQTLFIALAFTIGGTIALLTESSGQSGEALKTVPRENQQTPRRFATIRKPSAPLNVDVIAPNGFSESESGSILLEGTIELSTGVSEPVFFTWHLPEGVQLVDGPLTGMVPPLTRGQHYTTLVEVRGFTSTDKPQRIMLDVSTKIAGSPIGASSGVSSHKVGLRGEVKPRPKNEGGANFLRRKSQRPDQRREPAKLPRGLHL